MSERESQASKAVPIEVNKIKAGFILEEYGRIFLVSENEDKSCWLFHHATGVVTVFKGGKIRVVHK